MPTIDDILRARRQQSIFDRVASGSSSTAPEPPSIYERLSQNLSEPLPMEGRLSFLPAMVTPERGREWAVPGVLAGAWNAFTAPGRALQGQELGPEEALNVAGTAMLGGMPVARAGGPGTLGLNVFHGSPHKFDKFDMSKIGTGEGAQAYGHGLYLAEAPGVAGSYRNPTGLMEHRATGEVTDSRNIPIGKVAEYGPVKGNLYKVDLPDEQIAKMLDWDKPLSQQPEALAALKKAGYNPKPEMTAGEFVQSKQGEGFAPYLSDDLRKAGIPGIKYLDQGSRAGGKGTSNFVVFDDQIPKILSRE